MNLLARCIERPASELASFAPDLLLDLKLQAAEAVAAARAQADKIDQALDIRYGKRAAEQRFAAGKDTGTVTLTEGAVRISCEMAKKVEWDQAALGKIVIDAGPEDFDGLDANPITVSASDHPAGNRGPS